MVKRCSLFLAVLLLLLALAACASPPVEPAPPAQGESAVDAVPDTDAKGGDAPESGLTATLSPEDTAPEEESTPTLATAARAGFNRAAALPDGAVTLITLGDSLTEGMGDDDAGTGYPGRLLPKLQAARPGSSLVNLGRSGWTSHDLIAGLADTPAELTQALAAVQQARSAGRASLALVWIGSNDLWYLYEYGPEPITAEAEAQDLDGYRENLAQIVSSLRQAGAEVVLALLDDQSRRPVAANPPNPAERAFPATTAADLRRMSAHIQAYNQVIRDAADRYGTGLVDFSSTDLFTNPATLAGDGNHPNSQGYDRIAELWWQAIQDYLR